MCTPHISPVRARPIPGSAPISWSFWQNATPSMLRKSLLSLVVICSCNQRA